MSFRANKGRHQEMKNILQVEMNFKIMIWTKQLHISREEPIYNQSSKMKSTNQARLRKSQTKTMINSSWNKQKLNIPTLNKRPNSKMFQKMIIKIKKMCLIILKNLEFFVIIQLILNINKLKVFQMFILQTCKIPGINLKKEKAQILKKLVLSYSKTCSNQNQRSSSFFHSDTQKEQISIMIHLLKVMQKLWLLLSKRL